MKSDFTVHVETIEHCKLFWIICSYQWKHVQTQGTLHWNLHWPYFMTHTAHPAPSNLLMCTLAFSRNMLPLLSNFWQNLIAKNNEEQYSEFCLGLNIAQNYSGQKELLCWIFFFFFFLSWIYTSSYLSPWHGDLTNLPISVR